MAHTSADRYSDEAMRHALFYRSEAMQRALVELHKHPDERVPYMDLNAMVYGPDAHRDSLNGTLSSLTQMVTTPYGYKHWPWDTLTGTDSESGLVEYVMPAETCDQIARLLGETE